MSNPTTTTRAPEPDRARPPGPGALGQRLAAVLLAATLTFAGCGGSFETREGDASPPDSTSLKAEGATPYAIMAAVEDEAAPGDEALNEGRKSPYAASKAQKSVRCSWRSSFSANHRSLESQDAVNRLWRAEDPTQGEPGVPVRYVATLSSYDPDVINVVDRHVTPLIRGSLEDWAPDQINYVVSYQGIDAGRAIWGISMSFRAPSSNECAAVKRELSRMAQGNGALTSMLARRVAAYFTGITLALPFHGLGPGVAYLPEAAFGWYEPTAGCVIGVASGLVLAHLSGRLDAYEHLARTASFDCAKTAFDLTGTRTSSPGEADQIMRHIAWHSGSTARQISKPDNLAWGLASHTLRANGPNDRLIELLVTSGVSMLNAMKR